MELLDKLSLKAGKGLSRKRKNILGGNFNFVDNDRLGFFVPLTYMYTQHRKTEHDQMQANKNHKNTKIIFCGRSIVVFL